MADSGNKIFSTGNSHKESIQTEFHNEISNHPILDIILWKNPLKTVAILLSCLTLEVSLICFSVISVLAYAGLTFLIVATSFRLYLKFSGQYENNILNSYLDKDIKVNKEKSTAFTVGFINNVDQFILKIRSLLLIEDYFESLKLAIFLYFMTYIGAKFNFMTLVILMTLVSFCAPKIYQTYQVEVDKMYRLFTNKISTIVSRLIEKLRHLAIIGPLFREHQE